VTKTDIKYCVEEFKPEGFEISISKNREILCFPDGQWTYLDYPNELFQVMISQLFLQRVIEGINRKYNDDELLYRVYTKDSYIEVLYILASMETFNFIDDIDEAKVDAIMFIIDQLRAKE